MTSRRQKPAPAKIGVPDVRGMLLQTFRQHCLKRHPNLRFYSRGEHDADHRLHGESLDHIHKTDKGEEAPESVDPGQE